MTYQPILARTASADRASAQGPAERAKGAALRVEVVRSLQRFAELACEWDALASQHETPLALHGWYAAALDAQRDLAPEVVIPLIWRGQRLVGAAPLMQSTSGPRRLVPIDAFTGEPDRILYSDQAALLALADACVGLDQPILLRRFAAPAEDAEPFSMRIRKGMPGLMRQLYQTSCLHLPDSFEALEESMSKSRRKTIRRKQKMIEKVGGCELEVLTPCEDEVELLLARFARVENAGWKGRAGTSLMGDPTMARFISQVARSFARTGDTKVMFLKIDGQDASGRVVLKHRQSWCEIKIGYDEQFKRYSPGIILMHEAFRTAIEDRIRRYRFLGVSEDWQNFWPCERRWDFRLAAYPVSWISAGAIWADARRVIGSLFRNS